MGKAITAIQYQQKLDATNTIISFMGGLAPRYRAVTMHYLWDALSAMIKRYGEIFVADCINRSKTEAELALFRYGKKGAEA